MARTIQTVQQMRGKQVPQDSRKMVQRGPQGSKKSSKMMMRK